MLLKSIISIAVIKLSWAEREPVFRAWRWDSNLSIFISITKLDYFKFQTIEAIITSFIFIEKLFFFTILVAENRTSSSKCEHIFVLNKLIFLQYVNIIKNKINNLNKLINTFQENPHFLQNKYFAKRKYTRGRIIDGQLIWIQYMNFIFHRNQDSEKKFK